MVAARVPCQPLILRFDVKVHGGEKVADRAAIIAFGSRSEQRRSGKTTHIPKVDKARASCQGGRQGYNGRKHLGKIKIWLFGHGAQRGANRMTQPRRKRVRSVYYRVAFAVFLVGLGCAATRGDDWPQWRGTNRDGVWHEQGVVQRFERDRLPLRWRTPIGAGYSGPTVADGRVYVTDRVSEPEQVERVHCFDWQTGKPLWSHTYAAAYENVGYTDGPRAAVTIDAGRAFALGTMGHLHCLDAATGAILWQHDLNAVYQIRMPIWGIAAAPIVDQDLLIVQVGGSEGASIVAFDKQSGVERWRALDDRASYSAPIIVERSGRRLLICWTGDNVVGMHPQTGAVHWKHPFPPAKMVLNVATPVVTGNRLFLTAFYDGSEMLRLADDGLHVDRIWRRQGGNERNTDALHSIISTPLLLGDSVYGVDSYGELRCLDATTGERIWEDLTATPKDRWSTIHMVRNGNRIWMFNERGELIIATLSPEGFREISRAKLIDPTLGQLRRRGGVCWAHPAFAYRHVFARNDKELVCASLADAASPAKE